MEKSTGHGDGIDRLIGEPTRRKDGIRVTAYRDEDYVEFCVGLVWRWYDDGFLKYLGDGSWRQGFGLIAQELYLGPLIPIDEKGPFPDKIKAYLAMQPEELDISDS